MANLIDVRVTTFTAELNLLIPEKSTGKSLFNKIALTLGLHETWYFGIVYVDVNGYHRWLKMDKKVLKIKVKNKKLMKFNFLVKFYPEDVTEELIQNLTISLFYFQIRENILRGDIFCPPETALLLASLSCQVKCGDYDPEIHKPGCFLQDRILPERIVKQYRWSMSQWEETLIKWYAEHAGLFPEEAMLEYLKLAQDLEMYGVSYFLIINKKNSNLYLGVDAMGMNIYKHSDKLNPLIGFPWNEIRNISFYDTKFVIKPIDKNAPDFVFYTQETKVNKNILAICSGNHELSVRRRNPESIVVKQMKEQAFNDKVTKANERERLLAEKMSRVEAQRKLQIIEDQLEKKRTELANNNKVIESCFENCEDILKKIELDTLHQTKLSEKSDIVLENDQNVEKVKENENLPTECTDTTTDAHRNEIIDKGVSKSLETEKIRVKFADQLDSYRKESFDSDYRNQRRRTVIDTNLGLQYQLKYLENELKQAKIPGPVDELDSIYEINKSQGINKFQTLKQIRLGNTKKRIDAFECL